MLSPLLRPCKFTATATPPFSSVNLVLRPSLSLQLLLLQFPFEHDHLHFEFLRLTDLFVVGMQGLIGHALD